jgi:hypothetical protein
MPLGYPVRVILFLRLVGLRGPKRRHYFRGLCRGTGSQRRWPYGR